MGFFVFYGLKIEKSMWQQVTITLKPKPYGFHLVTDEIEAQLAEIKGVKTGLAHFFLQHTSAGITLNENADPTVRSDFLQFMNRLVPQDSDYFQHTYEGPDDMPAHIKSSLTGVELMIPIANGRLQLGTWQGVYLGEYRLNAGARRILVTIHS